MNAETVAFAAVAVVLLASSLGVVLTPNLFHAVLYLAAALVATGVVFLLLDAPFLFGVQLLLYAGGVVTIVVFAIMLTERLVGDRDPPDEPLPDQRRARRAWRCSSAWSASWSRRRSAAPRPPWPGDLTVARRPRADRRLRRPLRAPGRAAGRRRCSAPSTSRGARS